MVYKYIVVGSMVVGMEGRVVGVGNRMHNLEEVGTDCMCNRLALVAGKMAEVESVVYNHFYE